MRLLLIVFLLCFTSSVFAISADELRLLSGKADQERRAKSRRLDVNDLSSLLVNDNDSDKSKATKITDQPSSNDVPIPSNTGTVGNSDKGDVKLPPAASAAENNQTTHDDPPKPTNPVSNKHPAPEAVTRLLPPKGAHEPTPDSSSRQGVSNKGTPMGGASSRQSQPQPQVNYSTGEYIPPPRSSSSSNTNTSDVVSVGQRRFGITLGTWFKADLRRRTTNSDPGLIEMVIMQDVEGNQNNLPAGTYLFSEKSYNQGTKRLDLHVIKALLPDGDEIELSGLVYDSVKVAGLQGIIVENGSSAVQSGFKTGLISAGQTLINQASKGALGAEIITSTTDSIADNKLSTVDAEKAVPYTVHVSPQPVYIQIQQTF